MPRCGRLGAKSLTLPLFRRSRLLEERVPDATLQERKEGKCEAAGSGSSVRRQAEWDLTVAGLQGSELLLRCPEAGGGHSHFIISPKLKEVREPQSPAGCS